MTKKTIYEQYLVSLLSARYLMLSTTAYFSLLITYSTTSRNRSLSHHATISFISLSRFWRIFFASSIPIQAMIPFPASKSFPTFFPMMRASHSRSRISSRIWKARPRRNPNFLRSAIFSSEVSARSHHATSEDAMNPPVFSSWSLMSSSRESG